MCCFPLDDCRQLDFLLLSPFQAWVVLGNLFSLQREHDSALRVFERALQLDPGFTCMGGGREGVAVGGEGGTAVGPWLHMHVCGELQGV